MNKIEQKHIEEFFSERSKLIDKLDSGLLNKRDFLEENYRLIDKLNMKPYSHPSCYEECMYNYQYYNVMAKYQMAMVNRYGDDRRSKKAVDLRLSKVKNYYHEKDRAVLQMVKLLGRDNLRAYPVIMHSTKLNENLFEIHILGREKSILHSMDDDIRNLLRKMGAYDETPKISLIDSYVNIGY